MRLTGFSDYTLRVLMYLALDRDRLATIPEIAAAYGISRNHLMKVVQHLGQTGTVETVRGKGGGLRLARPPLRETPRPRSRAAEGDAPIVECLSGEAKSCAIAPVCRLRRVLVDGFDALYEHLDRTTLADLVGSGRPLASVLKGPSRPASGRAAATRR